MKKRNCRKTDIESEQPARATRVRKMTDAQLCDYLDGMAANQRPHVLSKEEIVNSLLDALSIRTEDGLRISDATIRKIREIAIRRGFLPKPEEREKAVFQTEDEGRRIIEHDAERASDGPT